MTPRDQLDLTGLRVLDGGLATELERAGCNLASPLWSGEVLRTQPEKVLAVHRSYLEAGADCLLTASYQVSAMGFREIGLSADDARSAIQQSVALAAQARRDYMQAEIDAGRQPRRIWIAGSLGAYGAALHNGAEFHGNYNISHAALVAFHAERIDAMRETNADFLAFETIPLLEEAEAILEALARFPDLAAYISFTCRDDGHTGHGEPIEACARLLDSHPEIIAIGINCTAPALYPAADPEDPRRQRQAHRRLPQLRRNLGSRNAKLERQLRPARLRRHGPTVARCRRGLDRRLLPHRPGAHSCDSASGEVLILFHIESRKSDNSSKGPPPLIE